MALQNAKPRVRPNKEAVGGTTKITRILVPIDFSRGSLKAIPYALAISRQFRADVLLLHVIDTNKEVASKLLNLPSLPQSEWDERLTRRLQSVALKYKSGGTVHVLNPHKGCAFKEICRTAGTLQTDLIVMSTHGHTIYKRTFVGSTAERVVQYSPCPVLVVPQHIHNWSGAAQPTATGFRLRRILVPTDFSECSNAGLNYATSLARDLGAQLRLVHVIVSHGNVDSERYSTLEIGRPADKASRRAEKRLRILGTKTRVPYSIKIVHGSAGIEISEAANHDADVIIISTHGRTGLRHVLLGSTAESVVRSAHCPVLVVPARRLKINGRSKSTSGYNNVGLAYVDRNWDQLSKGPNARQDPPCRKRVARAIQNTFMNGH